MWSWERTEPRQLTQPDQRDVPYLTVSCSAVKAGRKKEEVGGHSDLIDILIFFFLICCRKDLSDRGDVFDPGLSRRGLSERLHELQKERSCPTHRCVQVSLSLPATATLPFWLWDAQWLRAASWAWGSRVPRGAASLCREPAGTEGPGELEAGWGLCASQGAGGPQAWGQGGCLFLVRVL